MGVRVRRFREGRAIREPRCRDNRTMERARRSASVRSSTQASLWSCSISSRYGRDSFHVSSGRLGQYVAPSAAWP